MNTRILQSTLVCTYLGILASCSHYSLEERAEKEAAEFTRRYCPTPERGMQRTDSIVFDRVTHTFTYFHTLLGAADDTEAVSKARPALRKALLDEISANTTNTAYKEAGFSYRYVYRSGKTGKVLFQETLTKNDYRK